MARTENVTMFVCDRCGRTAYLAAGDPARDGWRDVERVTADGARASRLLCSACASEHKSLAAKHDAAFVEFMAGGAAK